MKFSAKLISFCYSNNNRQKYYLKNNNMELFYISIYNQLTFSKLPTYWKTSIWSLSGN